MQTPQLFAAILVSAGAFGVSTANAAETSHGALTREQVISELRAAQAQGAWHPAGELGDAPIVRTLPAEAASSASRADVVADLRNAQKQDTWKPAGEVGDQQVTRQVESTGDVDPLSRQAVVAELRDAQTSGTWHPAGEIGDVPIAQQIQQETALERGQTRMHGAHRLAFAKGNRSAK
jgi:hypothetical protein